MPVWLAAGPCRDPVSGVPTTANKPTDHGTLLPWVIKRNVQAHGMIRAVVGRKGQEVIRKRRRDLNHVEQLPRHPVVRVSHAKLEADGAPLKPAISATVMDPQHARNPR